MTNEEQDFRMDALLRQRLEGVEAPVSAGVWDRIQDARQERRMRPYGWAGFGALVLLTAAYAGWMTLRQTSTAAPVTEPIGQETASIPNEPGEDTAGLSFDSSDPAGTAGEDLHAAGVAPAGSRYGSTETASLRSAGDRVPPDNSSTSIRLAAARLGRDQSSGQTGGLSFVDQQGHQAVQQEADSRSDDQQQATALKNLSLLDNHFALHPLLRGFEDDGLSTLSASVLHSSKKTPSCYAFNSFLRGLSTDLYIAPEYASRQLVYKDPSMINYAERRNATEAYSFAFSAGFRVNAHFEGGLALRTGLVYTDIVEKLTFADPNAEVRRVITVSIDTIYNPPDVIIMVDTLSIVEYGQYDKVGYNNYRFYDVPLILGYEIDRGRWIVSLNTGVMLNVGTSRRGNMLDPASNLVSIHSARPDSYNAFRTKVGTSLLMSLGLNYAIRPKLHLLLEPQLRVWMRPLTLKDYPVDQKYVNMGLAMGVRQYF